MYDQVGRNRRVLGIAHPEPALDGDDESMRSREGFKLGGRIYL
jgi:hypothetical protein